MYHIMVFTYWLGVTLVFSALTIPLIMCNGICAADTKTLVILLSQRDSFHSQQAARFEDHFNQQVKELTSYSSKVHLIQAHKDLSNIPSPWRLFPVIEMLYDEPESYRPRWIFICEENSRVNISLLVNLVDSLDHTQDVFMGHAIHDQQTIASVVRNYPIVGMPNKFLYPDSGSGILLSEGLIQKIVKRLKKEGYTEFSMDASLELAAFIWNKGLGIALEHSEKDVFMGHAIHDQQTIASIFCSLPDSRNDSCVSWQLSHFPSCVSPRHPQLDTRSLFVAVKTCGIFHKSRVPIVKATWGMEAQFMEYYSDLDDEMLPSVNLGVGNTNRGHCAKTMAIIRHIARSSILSQIPWVLIADDDTIIYLQRLVSLLSCFNSTDTLVIGERYSYGTPRRGYEFPVGGSGMVLTQPSLRLLAENCKCYANDASDDLVIGMCLKAMGITMTHSKYFHQARPKDYSSTWLANQNPISFHKHTDVDPIRIYENLKNWLGNHYERKEEL